MNTVQLEPDSEPEHRCLYTCLSRWFSFSVFFHISFDFIHKFKQMIYLKRLSFATIECAVNEAESGQTERNGKEMKRSCK